MKKLIVIPAFVLAMAGCATVVENRPDSDVAVEEAENHDRIEDLVSLARLRHSKIAVQVRFVEVDQKTLDDVGAELVPGKESNHRYDIADFEDVSADVFERKLIARRDLLRNESSRALTVSGNEALLKSVTEYIYPTDFMIEMRDSGSVYTSSNTVSEVGRPGIAAVEPQEFMMREVGTIFLVTPDLEDDGSRIDCDIKAYVVDKPEWTDYGTQLPSPNGGSYALPMKQPFFPCHQLDTRLTAVPDETVLVGAEVSAKDKDVTRLIFFRARIHNSCRSLNTK